MAFKAESDRRSHHLALRASSIIITTATATTSTTISRLSLGLRVAAPLLSLRCRLGCSGRVSLSIRGLRSRRVRRLAGIWL